MVAPIVAKAAAQGAKSATKKAPRPKTDADRRYNERRKAKRAQERLEKQAKLQSGEALKETRKQINQLKKSIKGSYFDKEKKGYKQSLSEFRLEVKGGIEKSLKQSQAIKEKSFQQNQRLTRMQENYFNSATRTPEQREANVPRTSQQKLARNEANFFYSKTQVLWERGSVEMRNENIVAALQGQRLQSGAKVQNLQDAVQYIKEMFSQEYPTMESVNKTSFDTLEDTTFNQESEDESISPPPISYAEFRALGIL